MAQQAPVTRRVLPTAPALAEAVAEALVARLADAQRAGRTPSVGLTGGSIATAIHNALAEVGPRSPVDWSRVDFWWGDERFVPADSPDRNDLTVLPVLDALGADPARVHRMPAYAPTGVEEAAGRYAAELRAHGAGEFEVLMLGIGPDGHVASLFPGHRALAADGIAVGVSASPKPPPERVSLTLAALNRSREVWFVASGSAKASAVRAAQEAGPVEEIPARGVRGRSGTVWWLDRAAAGD